MQDETYRIPVKAKGHTVYALVSPEDYEALAAFKWFLHSGYARRKFPRKIRGPQIAYLMHREIMGLAHGDPMTVDHVNRDRLDNRRENLRVVTGQQNACNLASRPGTSRHRGVSWYKPGGIWRAQATFAGVKHYLGQFADEDDAARVINAFWVERGHDAPNDLSS